MSDIDHALSLLEMAKSDLRALAAMSSPDDFSDQISGFHAQQAVEKALKAWMAALRVLYPRTHDLTLLFDLLQDARADVAAHSDLDWLTQYAVQFRYELAEQGQFQLDRPMIVSRVDGLLADVTGGVERIRREGEAGGH